MNPPIPNGWIIVLGVVLPVLYQLFISKLPGVWKAVITYGLSALIAIACSVLVLHLHNIGDVLTNIAWIWAAGGAIYQLFIKTGVKLWNKMTSSSDSTFPPAPLA
jgi:hypothetical protein